jgi:putative FmdB family regulatory protein
MPIYAYKCSSCGHARDVLQKISDAPLTQCPACGAETFAKQLTAAGFQLKGSGWYATDFRNGSKPADAAKDGKDGKAETAGSGDSKADGKTDVKAETKTEGKSETKTDSAAGDKAKSENKSAAGSGS